MLIEQAPFDIYLLRYKFQQSTKGINQDAIQFLYSYLKIFLKCGKLLSE